MPEMQISNAESFDIANYVPPTALSITLVITITPPDGAVLVYSPKITDPVRFNGPRDVKEVPIAGPMIYVQKVQGATGYQIEVQGWEDDV